MATLPTDALAAAEFLVRRLYRPIGAASSLSAVAETEATSADNWFWNDDNAKVLELMARPEVLRQFPEETGEILRFVRSMCHGPFVFRRVAAPRLDPIGSDGSLTSYEHALMRLRYDFSRGAVVAGVRFHDERSVDNLMFSSNYVEFTYRGRRVRQPVSVDPAASRAEHDGSVLRLVCCGELNADRAWRSRPLGRVTYAYTFSGKSMLFDVEAALEIAPGIELRDVVLTIGHGGLGYCFFNNVVTDTAANDGRLFSAGKPATHRIDTAGASYYAIRQGHISGDSLAVHSMPKDAGRLAGIEACVEIQGRLDRVLARYEFPGTHRGTRLQAAETKLITAGGFYDRIADYARFMRESSTITGKADVAYDFSISYDYGVTLNAFAKCFAGAAAQSGITALPFDPLALRQQFDETLQHYFALYVDRHETNPNAIFSRELAFVALALGSMYRATEDDEYRRKLSRVCDVLRDFAVWFDDGTGGRATAFLMRKDSPRAAYVDCHSGVLLALTQAMRHLDDPQLAAIIDAGLRSYGLETVRFPGGIVDTVQTLMVDEHGTRRTENGYWNFKAGLTLRFFAALRAAQHPALQAVLDRHRDRIELLEHILRRQLAASITVHADGLELRCSVLSAETNSESQPWAVLGLVD